MKRLFQLLLILLSNPILSQNIWEPIILPDTLVAYNVYAEKEGIIFIGATANNGTSGLFKSIDNCNTWTFINIDTLYNVNYINVIGYDNDDDLFVNTNWGWYKSMDDGNTFEKVSENSGSVMNMVFSPNNSIYGLGWVGIIRSIDKGVTWDTLYYTGYTQYFHDIDFGMNEELYAVGGTTGVMCTGFYKSVDNGVTWEENGPETGYLYTIMVNDDGTILISGYWSENTYHSYDGGSTWNLVSNICADEMEFYSNDLLIAGRHVNSYSGCWVSQDWGVNWQSLVDSILNPNVKHISIAPSGTVFIQSENHPSYENHLFKSINPFVNTNETEDISEIALFPNPTNGIISIQNYNVTENDIFRIYNTQGEKVLHEKIRQNHIDITMLNSGIYIIEIETERKYIRKKIIKK